MSSAAWLNRCHFGDVREVLRRMAADGVKVNTIVTSPPYWGLRSYLPAGHPDKALEIGSEPTLREFLDTMVEVFDLAREVLRPDGTMWVNMGDSYASTAGGYDPLGSRGLSAGVGGKRQVAVQRGDRAALRSGLKPKDLVGQPWRLAFALQDDGWWLRQDIVWHKPNPMPESIRDRCTKAHEYVFLLAKSERYYYDFEAMQEPTSPNTHARMAQNVAAQAGSTRAHGGDTGRPMKAVTRNNGVGFGYADADPKPRTKKPPSGWDTGPGGHRDMIGRYPRGADDPQPGAGRRPPGAKASADENDSAYADGRGARMGREPGWRERKLELGRGGNFGETIGENGVYATRNRRSVWTVPSEPYSGAHFATFPRALIEPCILAGCPVGGTVLDIFFGSGTTGQVAQQLGRNFIGIDINPANEPLQAQRLQQPSLNLEHAP